MEQILVSTLEIIIEKLQLVCQSVPNITSAEKCNGHVLTKHQKAVAIACYHGNLHIITFFVHPFKYRAVIT